MSTLKQRKKVTNMPEREREREREEKKLDDYN
jgi:hypothetical protein